MSTLKGSTMHPWCRNIGACWDLLECWFKILSTSQNTSQIQFQTFLKKKKIWFPRCSSYLWRPFRCCISYLCRTDIDKARGISFLGILKLGVRTEFNFVNFELFGKFTFFRIPWCSTREDQFIDASITNVGLILTKLRWYFSSSSKVKIRTFFEKKSNFWVSMS